MPPKVEDYSFGNIKIDGVTLKVDLIICPDGIRENWWRKEGHSLYPEDIQKVLDEVQPDTVIIGRGANGALSVPDKTKEWIESKGITLITLPTGQAVEKYNELSEKSSVIAGLHLTC